MDLEFNLTLEDLYHEAMILDSTGRAYEWDTRKTAPREDSGWYGLGLTDILNSKWCYPNEIPKMDFEGLEQLGKTTFTKKWNDQDGIDMSMERYYEALPALIQLKKKNGFKFGKFIKIFANVGEHAGIRSEQMLKKAVCITNVADILESYGIRTEISLYVGVDDPGSYNGETVNQLLIDILVKKFEQPMNKSLLATGLSTWTFRYWVLMLMAAKMSPSWGYGRPLNIRNPEWGDDVIYVPSGTCYDDNDCNSFVKKTINNLIEK